MTSMAGMGNRKAYVDKLVEGSDTIMSEKIMVGGSVQAGAWASNVDRVIGRSKGVRSVTGGWDQVATFSLTGLAIVCSVIGVFGVVRSSWLMIWVDWAIRCRASTSWGLLTPEQGRVNAWLRSYPWEGNGSLDGEGGDESLGEHVDLRMSYRCRYVLDLYVNGETSSQVVEHVGGSDLGSGYIIPPGWPTVRFIVVRRLK